MSRVTVFILFLISQVVPLQAQTESKAIDKKFFEFDLYPFELAESSGRWGLKFKEVYDRTLAVNYLKRNFHYNNRVDTLIKNSWLALPFYDKFERWSYGPRFQFMAGTRGKKVDMFTISGELLATDVSEFLPEKINMEKRDVVLTMKTGNEWKWYYEGDFYNKNTTIYYQSPAFDKLEIIRDTIVAEFNFITEKQGVNQRYNVVGHELSGNVLALNNPVKSVPEKEQQPLQQTEIKVVQQETVTPKATTVNAAEQKAATEAEVKAAVAKALKEVNDAHVKELKSAEAKLKAEADKEIAALKAQLEVEQKARITAETKATKVQKEGDLKSETDKEIGALKTQLQAEQNARVSAELKALAEAKRADAAEAKFKKEEEEKNAALAKLREALEQAKAKAAQATASEQDRTDREAEIKNAVAQALKESEEKERKATEQRAQEEAKRTAEIEKAKQAAEAKAKAEEEQKNNAIKALKESEEKAKLVAEQKAKAEQAATAAAKAKAEEDQKLKKEAEIKAAVEKALKEAAEKERLAAEQKEEEVIRIAEAKAKAELAAAKAQPVEKSKEEQPAAVAPTQQPEGELIQDKNIIMKKIMIRDKLMSYTVFSENNLFGLKSADGTIRIYPAMKSMHITEPSNKELKYVSINAAIEFEMDGVILRITNPDFEGPDNLGTYAVKCATCSSGFKNAVLRWNKSKQKYIFE